MQVRDGEQGGKEQPKRRHDGGWNNDASHENLSPLLRLQARFHHPQISHVYATHVPDYQIIFLFNPLWINSMARREHPPSAFAPLALDLVRDLTQLPGLLPD